MDRQWQTTVSFTGHSWIEHPQYRTCFVSLFKCLDLEVARTCFGSQVDHPPPPSSSTKHTHTSRTLYFSYYYSHCYTLILPSTATEEHNTCKTPYKTFSHYELKINYLCLNFQTKRPFSQNLVQTLCH